ncbi:unnamed protein product [Lymnaea stagnalis]|uniref:Protein ARV n=1 Tax=Lymnaea stagnalis TaxID=6523 RepID=A0AAV2IBR9_LYMST
MGSKKMKYKCIECGSSVESLYRDYKANIIKIHHCESCQSVADKYIEYEPIIILLDALLLQPQAYRHLLLNTQFDAHWRLAFLFWICDAFSKLVLQRVELTNSQPSSGSEYVNYTYLGLELYLNFIIAATELLVLTVVVLSVYALKHFCTQGDLKHFSPSLIFKAVIIASLGHVLAIPALLWGQLYRNVYIHLTQGFVCLSTIQALRVVNQRKYNTFWAVLAVIFGFSAQMVVSSKMHYWLG